MSIPRPSNKTEEDYRKALESYPKTETSLDTKETAMDAALEPNTRSLSSAYRERRQNRLASRRSFVEHTYHEHYHDPPSIPPTISYGDVHSRKQRVPRGGVTIAFPEKLHDMLNYTELEGTCDIVSWQPHGRCFLIKTKKDFVEECMPR
jgi:HSF-type DNA-binding